MARTLRASQRAQRSILKDFTYPAGRTPAGHLPKVPGL